MADIRAPKRAQRAIGMVCDAWKSLRLPLDLISIDQVLILIDASAKLRSFKI
jgi:hypothetical protein